MANIPLRKDSDPTKFLKVSCWIWTLAAWPVYLLSHSGTAFGMLLIGSVTFRIMAVVVERDLKRRQPRDSEAK